MKLFVERFRQVVTLYPQKTAVVDSDGARETTYEELDRLSDKVAASLLKKKLEAGTYLPVLLPRNMEYLAAALGVLKAGFVLVPLTGAYPAERIAYCMEQCKAPFIVDEDFVQQAAKREHEVISCCIDEQQGALAVYTSGSTGKPKGITHSHKSLAAASVRIGKALGLTAKDRFLSNSSFHFIVFTIEIFANLLLGVTIHIHDEQGCKDIRRIENYILKHQISAVFLSPQLLKVFRNKSDSLRLALTAGERLVNTQGHGYELINIYGASETAASTTYFRVTQAYENTPIGMPFEGIEVYILSEDGSLVEDGELGEICISGIMTDGYLGLPEKTAEAFVVNPFAKGEDDRVLYRSGDLGKRLPDGNLVFVNRKDWMVKINGQRVEIGEIEACMNAVPTVATGVVKGFENEYGQTYLCGYFQLSNQADRENAEQVLREELRKYLPEYMVPQFLVRLAAFPLNLNGKIDRLALLAPDAAFFKQEYEAAQTDEEMKVCEAFEAVLNCGKVGANDDFFAIGGDSIKALMVQNLCEGLAPEVIFKGKTPRAIAALWDGTQRENWEQYQVDQDRYALTDSQMGVYLECMNQPDSTMYNIPLCFSVEKSSTLDIGRMEQALVAAARAYPVLQVVVDAFGGDIGMIKRAPLDVPVERIYVEEGQLERAKQAFVKPFDLERGPLFRFALLETKRTYEILADFHHIVFDGSSAEVFGHALSCAYEGKPVVQEDLDAFVLSVYDQRVVQTPAYREALAWFRQTMGGLEIDSNLIADYKREADESEPAGRYTLFLQEDLPQNQVEHFTQELGITENTFFLGGFAYALAKATGGEESLFCSVDNGRHDPRFANTLGMLVRTLPLYIRCGDELPIKRYLGDVQEGFFGAMEHDVCHFGELAKELGITSDIMFVYQADMLNGVVVDKVFLPLETLEVGAQANLTVSVFKKQGSYEIRLEYRTNLYAEKTIERFANLLLRVLLGLTQGGALKDIVLIGQEDVQRISAFNATEFAYDRSQTIVSKFEDCVSRSPDALAIVTGEKSYTYGEIDQLSNKIAHYIRALGLKGEDVVSVLIKRDAYMAIAPLGIMKAGCAYQPLDAGYPIDRLNFMTTDANCKLLLCDESLRPKVSSYAGAVLYTAEVAALEAAPAEQPAPPTPSSLMVLLYTSGTTGAPKGCMLTQSNLVHFCEYYCREWGLDQHTRSAAYASFGFDANMMDLWPTLTSGGQVHIISEEMRLDVIAMAEYFRQNQITIGFMTTQVGRAFALNLTEHPCPDLKTFLVGGETLVPFDPPKSVDMYNAYGPTEASVYATVFPIKHKMDSFPIGKAVYNTKLYVADRWMRMLPVGVPGELLLSGYGVGRGYLGRPDLTAQAFTENPFASEKGYERVYHTGDIVRYLPDGNIEFIGRRDSQVKVRGFRIELTEVEEIIRQFPPIADATVVAKDAPTGGKMICAYIVSDEQVDIQELNDFIAQQKPPYMVPALTMQIESIPLNINSKVDKRALPEPVMKVAELVAPATPMQQKIFDVLQPILGHDQFGSTTDIYDAGLTSIGVVTLNVALSEAFDKPIRIKDIKEHKTILQLEEFLQTSEDAAAHETCADYPLSRTQEGIFVECMANPNTTMYNIPLLLKLGKGVDVERLRDALLQTIEAHPSLKTTLFMDDGGDIRQKRNDGDAVFIEVVATLEPASLVYPFALMEDRLFRIFLHQADENYLFMDFHHIICDGTSLGIFIDEMNRAYAGEVLAKESYSGFEVALDEVHLRKGENYPQARDYYRQLLQGCDTDFLPAKEGQGGQPLTGNVRFAASGVQAIEKYCAQHNLTMNAFFTAAFGFLVGKYVYKDEAVFSTIYSGRNDSRMAKVLGMLVKTLPVYCVTGKDRTIACYITEVKDQLMNSMENDVYSFGEVSREFGVTADILFAYQGDTFALDWIAGQKAQRIAIESSAPKEPINLDVLIEGDTIVYACEFRQDLYSSDMMSGLLEALDKVASEFIEKKRLGEVSLLTKRATTLLQTFNDTAILIEPATANILLERQVIAHPDKTAVIANGEALTFAQLNTRANCIANALIARGLETEALVGLMLKRTVNAYAVRQGIMKAGGAFLTIDPLYPEDRIAYILEDSKAPYLIVAAQTAEACKSFLASCSTQVLILEELLAIDAIDNPRPNITGDNLAYSIYTSGSTGKPKGVMINHRNLVNYVNYNPVNTEATAYVEHAQVALAFAALTFDVSILEECIMLYNGITVCMANEDEIHNPLALSHLILKNHVDALTCTPSYLMNIIDLEEMTPALKQMTLFNIGAENFPGSLYAKIEKLGTTALILNGYGPTETTIGCTLAFITDKKVTIGRPMANMKMVMVDTSGNALPPGVPGEMMILGAGVGRGYIGKPKLTAQAFVTFQGEPAYHSGDMARWNFEGTIEFMGRIDNQVKLRGLRIELDEVENTLNSFDAINNSVVVVKGEGERQYLCAYFTAEREVSSKELQDFMSQSLTEYMVPSRLVQMEALPLTGNGKIDKKALPEPNAEHEQAKKFTKPRTELETQLQEIFAFALGFDQFGIDENFFDLGGTSLSVSKIAMKCMTKNLPVVYADVFTYQTVEQLAQYVTGKTGKGKKVASTLVPSTGAVAATPVGTFEKPLSVAMFDALSHNDVRYVDEVQQEDIGSLLLTGATGFLGIHVLYGYLKNYEGTAWCLVKKTKDIDALNRLKSLFFYYFDGNLIDLFEQRVRIVEGDITDEHLISQLVEVPFDTLIHCAASVKHFSADNVLEQINVCGVRNMIEVCSRTARRIVQISTVSVAGENVDGAILPNKKMKENELFFGQSITNQYINTKFRAEEEMLLAIARGVRGKIIRVGNLMSRNSDGEFQANSLTNGFMRMLRGYVAVGKFMVSGMDDDAEFSPIDSTAEAVLKLAGTNDAFTVFHAYNSHVVQMADVIAVLDKEVSSVEVVSDEEFERALLRALDDKQKAPLISGLLSYLSSDTEHSIAMIDTDNRFTTKILYRLGYRWPITDQAYLSHALQKLNDMGYFEKLD